MDIRIIKIVTHEGECGEYDRIEDVSEVRYDTPGGNITATAKHFINEAVQWANVMPDVRRIRITVEKDGD